MEIWKVWEEEEKRTEHEDSRVRRLVVSVVCWRTERGKNYDECRVNPVVVFPLRDASVTSLIQFVEEIQAEIRRKRVFFGETVVTFGL